MTSAFLCVKINKFQFRRPAMKKSLFPILVMLGVSFLFASCKNFLNADKVSDQIKDTIAYNNAKVVTVNIYSSEDIGSIYPQTKYEARIGYPFELEFIPNKQNYVIKNPDEVFKAVSFKDNSQSRSDYVEIIPVKQSTKDKQENVYKAQIKILQAADDILIKPNVQLVPQVIQSFPNYDNAGYPQDTSIKIYFNKAMDINSFADENGFLKNITITSGEKDLLERLDGKEPHYKAPYLEDENQTLVIPVLKGNYIIKDDSKADINVSLRLKGLYDGVEGENIEFAQEEYNFTFKINSSKDDKGPVFDKLYIAKTQEDALNGTNLIPMQEFSYYAKKSNFENSQTKVKKNIQDHHVNKVWIYFEAQDASSGVDYFEIKEQLIRTTTGYNTTGTLYNKTNRPATNKFANDTDTNSLAKLIEYDFNEIEDGVVKLELIAEDHAGNKTSCLVDLVKDTECPISIYLTNDNFKESNASQVTYTFALTGNQSEAKTYIFATDMDNNSYYDSFYSDSKTDFLVQSQVVGFEYGYNQESMNYIDLTDANFEIEEINSIVFGNIGNEKIKSVNITVDPYKDVFLNIYIKDSAGNINISSTKIAASIDVSNVVVGGYFYCELNKLPQKGTIYYSFENESPVSLDSLKRNQNIYFNSSTLSKFTREGIYTFYFTSINENIRSYAGKGYKIKKTSEGWFNLNENEQEHNYADNPITDEEIPKLIVSSESLGLNSNKIKIHVDYEPNFAFNPDYIYFYAYYDNNWIYTNANEFEFDPVDTYFLCIVWNKKTSCKYSEYELKETYIDTAPPSFSLQPNSYSLITFVTQDKIIIKNDASQGSYFVKDDSNIITELKYYLSNNPSLRGNIDWKNAKNIEQSGDVFTLETNGEDFNYLYLYAKDTNGNYSEKNYKINYSKLNNKISMTFDVDQQLINLSMSETSKLKYQYLNNKQWINTYQQWGKYQNPANSETLYLLPAERNTFIKIQSWYVYTKDDLLQKQAKYGDIKYYYIETQEDENTDIIEFTETFECDLKDYTQKNDRISVWADKPCLVHTMYSEINLGDDAQRWVNLGQETGIVMKQQSFTYTFEDNLSQVPENYYYTIVIHFADGDMMMTDVKQMQ